MIMNKPPRQDIIRGKPLNYSAPVAIRYAAVLEQLVRRMVLETRRELEALFRLHSFENFAQDASLTTLARVKVNELARRFDGMFAEVARPQAKTMLDQANASSATTVSMSIREMSEGLVIKTGFIKGRLAEVMSSSIEANVGLIKSIPEQYLDAISGAVFRSITTGNGLQDLVPFIDQHGAKTIERARFIARDQSRKAMAFLNENRLIGLGMKDYEWLHSGGSQHPRKLHEEMSGNIYSFENPPVIDLRTKERGIPGQLINCHCRMVPIIKFA